MGRGKLYRILHQLTMTQSSHKMPGKQYQALGRLKSGQMNKTEAKYAALLELRKQAGEVLWWKWDAVNLRLADKCFYKPDFMVMQKSGLLEIHETKGGFVTDDALVKLKVAAADFPFKFVMVKLVKGSWEYTEY